jgi:hypothetical protein
VATPHAPQAGSPAQGKGGFRRWRRARPFWGGLLLILSGLELFLTANMALGNIQLHVGPSGFLSYVIPAMLILCGAMAMATPAQRLFYGIIGSLVAVYSLIGVNFGGFLVGLVLGIIGGALTIAWSPIETAEPATAATAAAAEPAGGENDDAPGWLLDGEADQRPRYDHGQPYHEQAEPHDEQAQPHHAAGQAYNGNHAHADEAETAEVPRSVQDPDRWWGKAEPGPEEPPAQSGSGGHRGRLLAITLVPVTLATVALATVHNPHPAYAEPCPTPSASASGSPSAKSAPSKPAAAGGNKAQPSNPAPAPQNGAAPSQAAPSASAAPSTTPTGTGNPFLDGWNRFVDGVNRFFGGGKAEAPAPGVSASPSPSASGVVPGLPSLPGASAPSAPRPSGSGSASAQPQASASASSVPCVGAGVIRSAALPPGIPLISDERAILTGKTLTMWESQFDGVVEMRTGTGKTVKVLQFTMRKSQMSPFQLKVKESNGKSTVITSDTLITDTVKTEGAPRSVKFFATRFEGKLFGAIPPGFPILGGPFTPDNPPPLPPFPIPFIPLIFTDVTIDLAFVGCDILEAPNMFLREA